MIPSEHEINPIAADLDGQVAVRNFLGRTIDGAVELLWENSLHYFEDFVWMGPVAFRYYLPAITKFIGNPEFHAGADDVNCAISTLKIRLERQPADCALCRNEMVLILTEIISQYPRFDVSEEIYGNLHHEASKLLESLLSKTK